MNRRKFVEMTAMVGVLPFVLERKLKKTPITRRQWVPEDINAGLYVTRCSSTGLNKSKTFLATVTFQVGYNLSLGRKVIMMNRKPLVIQNIHHSCSTRDGSFILAEHTHNAAKQYTLNSVADGWSHGSSRGEDRAFEPFMGYSKEEICNLFNSDDYGYRPTAKEEMYEIINNTSKNFLT